MRDKLIELLRNLENESGFKNEYTEYFESYNSNYFIDERIDFPNYKLIIDRFNNQYINKKEDSGLVISFPINSIMSELKRMESDGLIMIGVQEGVKYATSSDNKGPNFDEGTKFTCESIILTTQGKSARGYFIHKITENPVTTALSVVAVIISLIALFV